MTVVISPKVKNVRKVSGFIPVMYALRYGMYMDPNMSPAPNAAAIPRSGLPCAACDVEAADSSAAPAKITSAPPITPAFRRPGARCNSLNSSVPHRIPTRLFEFHNGNARLKPMSFTANIVSVFPTAHKTARHHSPYDKVRNLPRIGESVRGAANERGQTPARDKSAEHHHERDHQRRNGNRDELGRRFGAGQPERRGDTAKYAQPVKRSLTGAVHCTQPQQRQPQQQDGKRNPKLHVLWR